VAFAGRLTAFWETRGVDEQLRLLHRVHGLRQVVLIQHEGCAYYRERLGVAARHMEREQREDLDRAASAVRRMDEALEVSAFYARRVESRIRFEPVPLALEAPRGPKVV
jgi:hypothetical protein